MAAPKREQMYKAKIVEMIRKYAYTYNYNLATVAELSGICYTTLTKRMNAPGDFKLDEINRIARAVHIPAKELAPILTWGWVA